MRFNYKKFLKLGALILIIFLIQASCQNESVDSQQDSSEITVKIIDFNEIQSNAKAINKLKKVSSQNNSKTSNTNRDIFYIAEYGFSINTDYVKYIEKEDYHSYNFSIIRDNPNTNKLENLLLSFNTDGGYNAYIVTYGFTKEEFSNEAFNNLDADLLSSRTTEYQLIDFDTSFLNKGSNSQTSSAKGGCVEEWVVVEIDPGDEGELVGAGNEEDPEHMWVLKSTTCSLGGSASSGGDSGGGSSGPGGGLSGSNEASNGPGKNGNISSPINQDGSGVVDDCNTSKEDLKKIFPKITDADAKLLASVINDKGKDFGIDSDEDLWHFLSQAGHETGGFKTLSVTESTYWKTASKLAKTYKKFTMDSTLAVTNDDKYYAPDYLKNSSGVANTAMCCQYGNGNVASGDGYKYRGRGLFQLTWKDNYTAFKTWYNNKYDPDIDPVVTPSIIASNDTLAILSGLWYYKTRVVDKITIDSTTTVKAVTKPINKARKGLADRKAKFQKAKDSINCL